MATAVVDRDLRRPVSKMCARLDSVFAEKTDVCEMPKRHIESQASMTNINFEFIQGHDPMKDSIATSRISWTKDPANGQIHGTEHLENDHATVYDSVVNPD